MRFEVPTHGFQLIPGRIGIDSQARLRESLGLIPEGAGRRGVLDSPALLDFARSETVLEMVRPHLPGEPRAVRALYFDKSAEANWMVAWHQDVTIAVRRQVETPGFGPWSRKAGVPHVQPPVRILEQMLSVRVHLDPADSTNGALQVLPMSHCRGRLNQFEIDALRKERPAHLCVAAAGDVLLMRPLLLHASGRSSGLGHRRILHLEYAGCELPSPLEWHENP